MQGLPDQPDGAGPDSLDVAVLLQQQEYLEQGQGIFFEDLAVGCLDKVVSGAEALVQGAQLFTPARVDDFFLEMLQQHFVQPADLLHVLVVGLHEFFHAGIVFRVVAELAGDVFLMIEQQAVFPSGAERMQGIAHAPQEVVSPVQAVVFLLGEEAVFYQLPQPFRAEVSFRDPADGLDIAQAARSFLDVGLQAVFTVMEFMVAGLLLFPFGREEFS